MIMPWVAFLIIEKSSELQNREICQIFFVISRATFVFSNSKSSFCYRDICTKKRGRNFRFYFFSTMLWSKSAAYRVLFTKKLNFLTSFFKTFLLQRCLYNVQRKEVETLYSTLFDPFMVKLFYWSLLQDGPLMLTKCDCVCKITVFISYLDDVQL